VGRASEWRRFMAVVSGGDEVIMPPPG